MQPSTVFELMLKRACSPVPAVIRVWTAGLSRALPTSFFGADVGGGKSMPIRQLLAVAVSALLTTCLAAQSLAQNGPQATDPKACSAEERLRVGPDGTPRPLDPKAETPTDKLARTEGVLCPPPNVDEDIKIPTPGAGVTPIIPPPGSPGGDPTVRPK